MNERAAELIRSLRLAPHPEGAPLDLVTAEPTGLVLTRLPLGPAGAAWEPVRVVPAGHWQAASTTGEYTLAGCAVGPGFDFADFVLLRDDPAAAERLRRSLPDQASLI